MWLCSKQYDFRQHTISLNLYYIQTHVLGSTLMPLCWVDLSSVYPNASNRHEKSDLKLPVQMSSLSTLSFQLFSFFWHYADLSHYYSKWCKYYSGNWKKIDLILSVVKCHCGQSVLKIWEMNQVQNEQLLCIPPLIRAALFCVSDALT